MIVVGTIKVTFLDMLGKVPGATERTVTITGDVVLKLPMGSVKVGTVTIQYQDIISSTASGYMDITITGDVKDETGLKIGVIKCETIDYWAGE